MCKIRTLLLLLSLFLSGKTLSKEKVNIVFSETVRDTASFYIEEMVQIYKSIGVEPIVSVYPEARASYLFEIGKVDALGAKIGPYEKVNPDAIKVDVPILDSIPFKIYVLKSDREKILKLKEPFILSTVNCIGCEEFSKIFKSPISAYSTNIQSGLKMLEKGRADLIIAATIFMDKVPGKEKFVPLNEWRYIPKVYHFISSRKLHLKEKLTVEILKAKKRGAFDLKKLQYKK